jgi:hypothetical protein
VQVRLEACLVVESYLASMSPDFFKKEKKKKGVCVCEKMLGEFSHDRMLNFSALRFLPSQIWQVQYI